MQTLYFDIETASLPDAELAGLIPSFDPAAVKTGNLKDPEKIAAKIAETEVMHRQCFFDNAALDPLTGRVIAIGILTKNGEFNVIAHDDERRIIEDFWRICRAEMGRFNQMVGFNIFAFDLPFLIRRSWKHRVPVPFGLRRGRYWNDNIIDLREIWQLGERNARGSLDSIARHLGVGSKDGNGSGFAKLWESDRTKANNYLKNDLELTRCVAEALCIPR